MDIEGSKLEILHQAHIPKRIECLVFEYSFSIDASVANFKRTIQRLKKFFKYVKFPPSALHRPVDEQGKEIKYSDRDVIVHCWNRK